MQHGSNMASSSPYFTAKLPAGHELLGELRPALLGRLRAHVLLSPAHAVAGSGAQPCREQCAIMLWIDDGRCTLTALRQLTPVARIAICTTLGVPATPVAPATQAARILQHINDKKAAAGNAAPAAGGPHGGGGAPAPAAAPPLAAVQPPPAALPAPGAPDGQAPLGAAAAGAPAPQSAAPGSGAFAPPSAGGGLGGEEDHEVHIRPPSRIDTLVTTVQRNIAHGMPWRDARLLVKNSGIPIPDDTYAGDVAPKLLLAVWAAEAPRTAGTVRALDDYTQQHVMAALQVDGSWPVPVQDAYIDSVLKLCRESCWARDPDLSHGLLSAARRGALALLSQVQAQTGHQPGARAQLAAALSVDEFQHLEALLTRTGRSFNDVSVTGDTWTLSAAGGSALSPAGTGGGGTIGSSGWTGGASSSSSTGGSATTSSTASHAEASSGAGVPALAQTQAEEQLLSLRFDVHALMSPKESGDLKARQKNAAAGVGEKRERSHPDATSNSDENDLQSLAQYPWNQRWKIRPSLSLSMLGRALRIGLTFCNEHCTGQLTTLVHNGLKREQDAIYSEFSAAANGDASGVAVALCIIPRAISYASSRAKAVLQDAEQQARAHPSSALLAFASQGRSVQEDTVGRFLDEVVKRITTEASAAASPLAVTACTILMYQEFLAGWMAPVFSFIFCEDLEQRWRLRAQASAHQGGAGNTSVTPKGGGESATQGGGGGSGGSLGGKTSDGAGTATQGQSVQTPFAFRHTIPCTIDIIGNTLGVPHQVACRKCKPVGRCHPNAECPARWAQVTGSPLPGFDADGTRTASAWCKNKEPIKATIRAWIALIKDHSKWNGTAPVPAGVRGAPSLADFEGQLARAPEKP